MMNRFASFTFSFISLTLCSFSLEALVLYWDTNGSTEGSSNIRHTWDTNPATTNWSTSADGTLTTQGWTAGGTAIFSAGTNATGSILVDIAPSTSVSAIQFQEGTVEVSGAFYSGSIVDLSTVDVASGITATLNATLTQSSGAISLTKTGAGTLNLIAPNSTTGSTTVSGGTVNINSIANLGSGDITVNNGATLANSGILELNSRTINVTGSGSSLSSVGYIEVGDVGSTTLNITSGGEVSSQSSIAFGVNGGVTGTGTISGTDSLLSSTAQIFLGYYGTGNLTIADGGRVNVGTVLSIANQAGSAGTLNLNTGGTLAVGGTNGIVAGGGTATWNWGGGTVEVSGSSLTTSLAATLGTGTESTINTNGFNATFSGTFSGAGGLAKTGTGTLYLTNASNQFGSLIFSAGTVDLGGYSPTIGTAVFDGGIFSNGTLSNASAYEVRSGSLALSLSGSQSLTKTGSGTFTLEVANSYTGGTTVEAGTLVLGNEGSLGSTTADLTLNGGTLDLGGFSPTVGAVIFDGGDFTNGSLSNSSSFDALSGTVSGSLDGSVALTKTGSGTFILTGANTHTGLTTISEGVLQLGDGGTTGSLSGTSILNNATLAFDHSGATSFSGSISGSGNLTKTGAGTLTLSGTNTYSGGTTVNGGTLMVNTIENLGSGDITVSNGQLTSISLYLTQTTTVQNGGVISAPAIHVASDALVLNEGGVVVLGGSGIYSGGGTGQLNANGGTLRLSTGANISVPIVLGDTTDSFIDTNGFGGTLSSTLTGTGGWTKTGEGTLTFSGTQNHTGGTTVDGGTLVFTNDLGGLNDFREIEYTVNSGTLNMDGRLYTGESVTVSGPNATFSSDGSFSASLGETEAITISNGGNMTVQWWVGVSGNDSGTGVVVTGAGSRFEVGGDFSVGTDDNSSLVVSDGGQVVGGNYGHFGETLGSLTTGTALVTGMGSRMDFDEPLLLINTGEGGVTITSGGTVSAPVVRVANQYQYVPGTINILNLDTGGTLQVGGIDGITLGTGGLFNANGGTLQVLNSDLTSSAPMTLGNTFTVDTNSFNATLSGVLSGEGSLSKAGVGTLTLSGANTYTGDTSISAGTLALGHSNALQNSTLTTADGLSFGSLTAATLGGLSGSGELVLENASSQAVALTVGATDADTTYSGVLSGSGSLIKDGTGTFTLSGNNTYSGATTISDGTIRIGHESALGSTASVSLGAGSNLNLNNYSVSIGGLEGAGGVALGSGSLTTSSSGNHAFSGVISGTGALIKSGSGTLTLSGDNTFTGTTTISAGTLQLGDGGTSGALVSPSIVNSGTLAFNRSDNLTFSTPISGTGSLVQSGTGTLTLAGSHTYTGGTTVSAGVLSSNTASLQGNITNNAAVVFDQSTNGTFSGNITGSGSLTKTSDGTLTLTGTNSYTGETIVNGGTLTGSSVGTFGSGDFTVLNGGSILHSFNLNLGSDLTVDGAGSVFSTGESFLNFIILGMEGASTVTITDGGQLKTGQLVIGGNAAASLNVSGTDSVVESIRYIAIGAFEGGSGTLTIENGAHVFAPEGVSVGHGTPGVLNLNAGGTLQIGAKDPGWTWTANLQTGGAPATFNFAGGTLLADGDFTANLNAILSNTSTIDTATFGAVYSGVLSGAGNLVKAGESNLSLSGNNTFTGTTTISEGTLTLGHENALAGSTLTTAGGLSFGALTSAKIGGLSGSDDLALNNAASSAAVALNLGGNNESTTYSGDLSGSGSLTKAGSGTLTLSGNNTYTGATSVIGGTLQLGSNSALAGTSAVDLASGTTLDLNGYSATLADLDGAGAILLGNGHLTTGDSAGHALSGLISGTGSLTKTGTGSLTLSGTNTYSGGTTVSGGTLIVSSDTNLGSSSGSLTVNSGATLNTGGDFRPNRVVTLDGTGTQLYNNGELIIGYNGTGSLSLTNNATASTYNLTLAYTGGTGTIEISSGSTLSVGNITALGTAASTVNINSGGTLSTAGFSSAGTLNLNTGGLLVTSGFADSGTFNFAGGTLRSGGSFSSGVDAILSNISSIDTNGYTTTLTGILSGTGSLTKTGEGLLSLLMESNSYTGGTTVSAGTLNATYAEALPGDVVNNAAVSIAEGTYAGVMSGSGSLTKSGAGTLILAKSNTYTGGTIVSGGELAIGAGEASGSLSGNIINNATVIFNRSDDYTFSGVISGTGDLTMDGYILRLSQAQTYTGATSIASGAYLVLPTSVDQGLSTSTSVNLESGAFLDISDRSLTIAGLSGSGTIYSFGEDNGHLTVDLSSGQSQTFSGGIGGSYPHFAFTKSGDGTLTLSGANNYSGGTTINGGVLEFQSLANFGSGNITMDGGTLRWASGSTTDFHSRFNAFGDSGATFDTNGNDVAIYAPLSGTGGLTKIGTGVLTVTNNNTYSGGTTVSAGTLLVNTASDLGTGSVHVSSGASLAAATHFEFRTDVTVDGADAIVLSPNHFEVGSAGDGSLALTNGARSGSGTTTTLAYYSGDTGTISVSGTDSILYAQSALRVGYGGSGTLTVSAGGSANADSLILGSQSDSSGILNLNTGGVLQVGGTNGIQVGEGTGTFNLAGGTLRVGGDDRVVAPPASASLDLTDLSNTLATVIAANTPQEDDTGLTTSIPMTLTNTSTIDTNGSSATLSGTLSGTGYLIKVGTGTLNLSGTNTYSGGTTINEGTLSVINQSNLGSGNILLNNGTLTYTGGFVLNNSKLIQGEGTITGTNSSDNAFSNNGTIIATGDGLTFTGYVNGNGNFTGDITMEGTLNPGASPGKLEFETLTLTNSSTVEIEIGGTEQGISYDFIDISGHAVLDGTLDVHLLNDFILQTGDTFVPISWASYEGTFDHITGLTADNGLYFVVTYLSNGIQLTSVPEPELSALFLGVFSGFILLWKRRKTHR